MVVVHARDKTRLRSRVRAGAARRSRRRCRRDPAVTTVVPPQAGVSISPDRHTAVIRAGAARDANDMVRAADELKGALAKLGADGVRVDLTGAAGMWSDFNQANRSAMMKSELISWPVTLAILVLAFGSLVAAGLPLMLTIVGLVAAAGSLWMGTRIADISIWSMNFALMFALALGIDYALFIVYRFRARLLRIAAVGAGGGGGDDGHRRQGGAVLGHDRADLAERGDARAEPGVPVDEPRDHARRSSSSWRRR